MTSTITRLLHEWNLGDPQALDRLVPYVYEHLRAIASRQMRNEHNITLQPTELVHEIFLRLSHTHSQQFRDRIHFYGAAAELMRRVLIDLARRRDSVRRGGALHRVELSEDLPANGLQLDFERLDEAITTLGQLDARQAEIVRLRFFCGLTNPQVAQLLKVSEATVKREWHHARAYLLRELAKG